MTVRRVLTWPDKRLTISAQPVEDFDDELISLCKDMADTMKASFGIGLAATQINVQKAICVIANSAVRTLTPDPVMTDHVVLVNPKIDVIGPSKFKWEEQCLSIPNFKEEVERNTKIVVRYQDLSGKLVTQELIGHESATIQHEVDHLFGKLFIHQLKGARRSMVFRKLQKAERKKSNLDEVGDDSPKIGRPKRRRTKNKKGFGKLKKRKK